MKKVGFLTLIIFVIPVLVSAHPGRRDAEGCHYCRTNCEQYGLQYNERHCHETTGIIAGTTVPTPNPTPTPMSPVCEFPAPPLGCTYENINYTKCTYDLACSTPTPNSTPLLTHAPIQTPVTVPKSTPTATPALVSPTPQKNIYQYNQTNLEIVKPAGSPEPSSSTIQDINLKILPQFHAEGQIQKADIRGWDPKEKKVIMIPTDVQKESDFEDYVRAFMAGNPKIKKVLVKNGNLEVVYGMPAKLLGFIPISLETKIITSSNHSRVDIRFPWYETFTKKYFFAEEVKKEMDSNFETMVLQDNIQDLSRAFQAIANIMKTKHDTVKNSINNIR